MKIVLVGYMASGKSTIGRLLASRLGVPFIDLDEYIEAFEKKTIPGIFAEKGELYFRKLEHQMLGRALAENDSLVLATGGGTPVYGNNMQTLLDLSDHTVYLQWPIPELVTRIAAERESRPLVRDLPVGELPEFIGKHLFERIPYYGQADHILDCSGRDVQTVVAELEKILL